MKKFLFPFVVLLAAFPVVAEPTAKITAELEDVFKKYVEYCNTENIRGVMEIMHSKSAEYASTRIRMARIAAGYDLKYELMSFNYVGITGEYAIARTVQKTSKIKGPSYRNNILEALQVFKREDGKWKIWTTAILSLRYCR
ncbi:MAG: hypothetical protein PHV59_07085 [Victivallales bacterium]|nr:hypothetical protein [Victivallales bacterium]